MPFSSQLLYAEFNLQVQVKQEIVALGLRDVIEKEWVLGKFFL